MPRLLAKLAALGTAGLLWTAPPPPKPKLVVLIAVDQFRYDYLTRFQTEYKAGFRRLLDQGAVFASAHYVQFPAVTAVGHSVMLTGANPSVSGIIANEWFDRESRKEVTSVSDPRTRLVGGSGCEGASPRRLLVDTVGDELKLAAKAPAKVIGISMKDRASILPAGHKADAAYWFENKTGAFVSSTYYLADLPGWAKDFNQSRAADSWAGKPWTPESAGSPFLTMPAPPGPAYWEAVYDTPYGNEMLEQFAEKAIEAENLGRGQGTDLLTLSFSSNDRVGHKYGPQSPQVHDACLKTDKLLGRLLDYIDRRVGPGRTLVVVTADHGVAPMPESGDRAHLPGGRFKTPEMEEVVRAALTKAYGRAEWLAGKAEGGGIYLNRDLIQQKRLSLAEVQAVAATALRALPYAARVFTHSQLMNGQPGEDIVSRNVWNGFNVDRSPDVIFVAKPFWIYPVSDTTHYSPYTYDTHVPLIFLGPGVRPGRYPATVAVRDLAPTLSYLLEIDPPAGNAGRVLEEMLDRR